jgi:hypothetical protein
VSRQCGRQQHRANPRSPICEDYFRQTIFVPYLDSLISSLTNRFSEDNSAQFKLFSLHPDKMAKLTRSDFKEDMTVVNHVYNIDNFDVEALS